MTQEERAKVTQDQYSRWKMNADIGASKRREEIVEMQKEMHKQWKAKQDDYESRRSEIAQGYIKERQKSKPMTVGKILEIFSKLPADCTIASDSGWECDPTDIEQIWYIKEFNEVYLTQREKEYSNSIVFENCHDVRYKAVKIYDADED